MTVIHVAKKPTLESAFAGEKYIFFDYAIFEEEDNIPGMYMRLSYLARQKKADLVIFDFERIDTINLDEYHAISSVVKCINLRQPLRPDVLTAASNIYVEMGEYVSSGKTRRNLRNTPGIMSRPQAMVHDAAEALRKILGI